MKMLALEDCKRWAQKPVYNGQLEYILVDAESSKRGLNHTRMSVKSESWETNLASLKKTDMPRFRFILNIGGSQNRETRMALCEAFDCITKEWRPWVPLPEPRAACSVSITAQGNILVCGGRNYHGEDCSTIMSLNAKQNEWLAFPARLPVKCSGHSTIVYDNRLYLIGGGDHGVISDTIYEITLAPPYSTQQVCIMEHPIYFHGCECIGTNIFIVGGSTTSTKTNLTNRVVRFDTQSNVCTDMVPLPFAVGCMATARRGVHIIIAGGCNERGEVLNSAFMYNTVNGQAQMLPNMKERRRGCTAVMDGNWLVVMGGVNEYRYLSSVEAFSFEQNCWVDQPMMSEVRAFSASVLVNSPDTQI